MATELGEFAALGEVEPLMARELQDVFHVLHDNATVAFVCLVAVIWLIREIRGDQ